MACPDPLKTGALPSTLMTLFTSDPETRVAVVVTVGVIVGVAVAVAVPVAVEVLVGVVVPAQTTWTGTEKLM